MSFHSGHVQSYYIASAKGEVNYHRLEGAVTADVCVVGAGFTGLSTAIELAEKGFSVVLLEARRVGWGASGRNGGHIIGGFSGEDEMIAELGPESADLVREMGWTGNDIIRNRVEKYKLDCDFKSGQITVAHKARHMAALEAKVTDYERLKLPYKYYIAKKDEISAILGTDAYKGGLLNMGGGHVHSLDLCLEEARLATRLGVRIFEHSEVTRLEQSLRPKVHTKGGVVDAEMVVLAANGYQHLDDGLESTLYLGGSYMIATEPLGDDLAHEINPMDLAVSDNNAMPDYFRLSADKRMLFGGRCNYSGKHPRDIKSKLLPRLLKIYPQLKGVRIDYQWGGRLGLSLNKIPQVGRLSARIFYSQAYSGHGVNFSHLAGSIIADAVGGNLERIDLFEKIRPVTLPYSDWTSRKIISLGQTWNRLRDLL